MKETEHAMENFHLALDKMSYKVPPGKFKGGWSLVKQFVTTYFKTPLLKRRQKQVNPDGFYDNARCLIHLIHVYRSLNRNMLSFVPAFKLLELAENASVNDSHEVSLPCSYTWYSQTTLKGSSDEGTVF